MNALLMEVITIIGLTHIPGFLALALIVRVCSRGAGPVKMQRCQLPGRGR